MVGMAPPISLKMSQPATGSPDKQTIHNNIATLLKAMNRFRLSSQYRKCHTNTNLLSHCTPAKAPTERCHAMTELCHATTERCHAMTELCHAPTERCHATTERCHAVTARSPVSSLQSPVSRFPSPRLCATA